MTDPLSKPSIAFSGMCEIAQGPLIDVVMAVKDAEPVMGGDPLLFFDGVTGAVIDVDLRGETAEIVRRLADRAVTEDKPKPRKEPSAAKTARGRGRPKLGVVAREVTLLPRHWDWLAEQPGGASQALRRLVEQARKGEDGKGAQDRAAQEAAYRFMSALAGDLPGYEEAIRALFAGDRPGVERQMADWPEDVRAFSLTLAYGGSARKAA